MAEVRIQIGGREFEVACRNGEEHYLQSAAGLLNNEASALNEALGRMPETRMLLMAGLMLADKTASLEDQLKQKPASVPGASEADPADVKRMRNLEDKLGQTQAALADTRAKLAETEAALAEKEKAVQAAIGTRIVAVETMNRMLEKVEDAAENMTKAG